MPEITEEQVYRFKKDDPNYYENRKKHLINLTKERYKNDAEFREKARVRSKMYYDKLKAALQEKEKTDIKD